MFTTHFSTTRFSLNNKITIRFCRFSDSNQLICISISLFQAMVNSGRVELLMHPLTQKFLEMKWHAYGMYINMIYILIYLFFLGAVTSFAAGVLGGGNHFHKHVTSHGLKTWTNVVNNSHNNISDMLSDNVSFTEGYSFKVSNVKFS